MTGKKLITGDIEYSENSTALELVYNSLTQLLNNTLSNNKNEYGFTGFCKWNYNKFIDLFIIDTDERCKIEITLDSCYFVVIKDKRDKRLCSYYIRPSCPIGELKATILKSIYDLRSKLL